jgi:hypothetical protein
MTSFNGKTSKEIESKFQELKMKVWNYILKDDHENIPQSLFQHLEDEFNRIETTYDIRDDKLNLFHVKHNYLLTKFYEFFNKDQTISMELLIDALSFLLERHLLRKYQPQTFEKMLLPYFVAIGKIKPQAEKIHWNQIEGKFLKFLDKYTKQLNFASKNLGGIFDNLTRLFFEGFYEKRVSTFSTRGEYLDANEISSRVNTILSNLMDVHSSRETNTISYGWEILYKIKKRQLHYLVRFNYFEETTEKRQSVKKEIEIITDDMCRYSSYSLKAFEKYYKNRISNDEGKEEDFLYKKTLKELDTFTASYFLYAYSKLDILKAWNVLDKIKTYLVGKAFKENVPLSDTLLEYYGEEWSVLYIFAKISLLREEIMKREKSVKQEWQKEMFKRISLVLEEEKKLFKYELTLKRDYNLKIMTSQFAGGFSEYLIHDLAQKFYDFGPLDEQKQSAFFDLFHCIKTMSTKDDIVLNKRLSQNDPDIDIYMKNKGALFLKNSTIEADEMKQLWKELTLCNNKNIKNVYFGINFVKNIHKIEYIRVNFKKMTKEYSEMYISVFDIKDLVEALFQELERSKMPKTTFQKMDFYRILDY